MWTSCLSTVLLAAALSTKSIRAASLSDICTTSSIQDALPSNGTILGVNLLPDTVTASVANVSTSTGASGGGIMGKRQSSSTSSTSSSAAESQQFCNVTVAFSHTGRSDMVNLNFAFPAPSSFANRFYVGGGGGYSLNSDPTGGLTYGAASGVTDGGYDAFDYSFDEKFLFGNGSINWDATYAFSYQALGEMTKVGKYMTKQLYAAGTSSSSSDNTTSTSTGLYTYYSGCSDGGREGMSQIQRYGDEYDGAITGAPAFRFAQQQILHVFPATVETVQGYFPPPCALQKVVNATIEACDAYDGRKDGVIARTDLCKVQFNLTSIIGQTYNCAAQTSSSLGFGYSGGGTTESGNSTTSSSSATQSTSAAAAAAAAAAQSTSAMTAGGAQGSQTSSTPAQNGTITAQDVAVAQAIYDGLFTSDGQQAYLSWQIGSSLDDGETTYDNSTDTWRVNIPSTGGMYVTKFVQLLDIDNLSSLDGVTYDTLVEWMTIGFNRYYDSLQTTLPDLSTFKAHGGKLIHYHGESDPSVPAASSVHYRQSVRTAMYPNVTLSKGESLLNDWYQLYLVPGAAHCGANSLQPGPYPSSSSLMEQMIAWVENGEAPTGLNASVSSGSYSGETQMLCQWPLRPQWSSGNDSSNSTFNCVEQSDDSIGSWTYSFDQAFKQAVY